MCVVSMVYDHYNKQIPQPGPSYPWFQPQPPNTVDQQIAARELRALIAEFREAIAAAKRVDELTDQADCLDPEKAKLDERVARLEKILGVGDDRS